MSDKNLPEQTQFHLAQSAALAVGPDKAENPSVDTPVVYKKDVLSLGNFKANGGSVLEIEPARLKKIIEDSNRYVENGNSIEFVANHTGANNKPFEKFDSNKENRSVTNIGGYCNKFRANDDGSWATCDIGMTTEGGVQLAQSSKDVSIELDFNYEDTQGNKYDAVIRRVAAVQKPVIPGQKGYEKIQLSEYFADTETFVLTTNKQEESNMGDQKEENEFDEKEMSLMKKFFKSFKLSEESGTEEKPVEDKSVAKIAELEASLEVSNKSLADEQKKTAKAEKDAEKSAIASLVTSAKSFGDRIKKLNIDVKSKDALQVALGIDEDPEKINKLYLSEDEDGETLANQMIGIFENIELVSTSEKTLKLSEYHSKSDNAQAEEDAKYIKEKAQKSKEKLGFLNKEAN
ncbi:MAG: hypothetical protein HRT35_02790 [Algicola sp.]|nr:hypothetical protein [Algicola sp.]